MIYLLAFGPLAVFFVGMCWIVAQPKANYVGIPPSPATIIMRVWTRAMKETARMMGAALIPAFKYAAEGLARFKDAWPELEHDEWPVHQPAAPEAPIPGRHWYAGCEPGGDYDYELGRYTGEGPRVNPITGICEGCGQQACPFCGREHPDEEECPG